MVLHALSHLFFTATREAGFASISILQARKLRLQRVMFPAEVAELVHDRVIAASLSGPGAHATQHSFSLINDHNMVFEVSVPPGLL